MLMSHIYDLSRYSGQRLNRLSQLFQSHLLSRMGSILTCLLVCFSLDVTVAIAQVVVTGTVYDAETEATLPGVNIVIQGTSTGTVTNSDGEYSLEVIDPDALLIYSFVGYSSQHIEVGEQEVINVHLEMGLDVMDELVVVG